MWKIVINFYKVIIVLLLIISSGFQVFAKTYKGIPLKEEPGFTIDLPEGWYKKKIEGNNGTITYFYPNDQNRVVIEIRAFRLKEDHQSIKALVNHKAARLSYYYPFVQLIYERFSILRAGVYETLWNLENRDGKYIEKSILLKDKNDIIIIGVSAPENLYENYNVIFENALMSADFSDKEKKSENRKSISEKKVKDDDPFYESTEFLKNIFLFNRPFVNDSTLEEKEENLKKLTGK